MNASPFLLLEMRYLNVQIAIAAVTASSAGPVLSIVLGRAGVQTTVCPLPPNSPSPRAQKNCQAEAMPKPDFNEPIEYGKRSARPAPQGKQFSRSENMACS
jgi:hypothetical protein